MKTKDKVIEFFSYLDIDEQKIHFDQKEEILHIDLELGDRKKGLFIGRHARTLDALQRILSFVINNQLEEHKKILLDIGNYRKERLEKVEEIANDIAQDVLSQNTPKSMPNLSSTERRHIHMYFADNDDLTTFSQGEGRNRRLFIAPQGE